MLCTGICNIFESLVTKRLCGLLMVISEISDTFCIVAVSDGSGLFCDVFGSCCGSCTVCNCCGSRFWNSSVWSSEWKCKVYVQ